MLNVEWFMESIGFLAVFTEAMLGEWNFILYFFMFHDDIFNRGFWFNCKFYRVEYVNCTRGLVTQQRIDIIWE